MSEQTPDPAPEPRRRASGRTAGEEVAKVVSEQAEDLPEPTEPGERDLQFDTPGFQRIRTHWAGDDAQVLARVHQTIDKILFEEFSSLYQVYLQLQERVRLPLFDPATGEVLTDVNGFTRWQIDPLTRMPIEDFSQMTDAAKRDFIYKIMNYLQGWRETAERMRTDALFAKAKWEELFAIGFESLPAKSATKPTERDRESRAKIISAEERYHAVFRSALSRRADALVRSMEDCSQRMKDMLPQR